MPVGAAAIARFAGKGSGKGKSIVTKQLLYTDFQQRKDREAKGDKSGCCCTNVQLIFSILTFELLLNVALLLILHYSLVNSEETV